MIVGGVGNGFMEEDQRWHLNLGMADTRVLNTRFWEWKGTPLTTWLRKQESKM